MIKASERVIIQGEVYLGGVEEFPRLDDTGNNVPENTEHKHVITDEEGGPQILMPVLRFISDFYIFPKEGLVFLKKNLKFSSWSWDYTIKQTYIVQLSTKNLFTKPIF